MVHSFIYSLVILLSLPAAAADWSVLTGDDSGVDLEQAVAARDEKEWAQLWERHADKSGKPAPAVDFAGEQVVAFFLGNKPQKGWTIRLDPRVEADGALRLRYEAVPPAAFSAQTPTRPYKIMVLARTTAVAFERVSPIAKSLAAGENKLKEGTLKGGWYASWGYNVEHWAPSDITVSQPSLGNHFTVHDVKAVGEQREWQSNLMGAGLTVPPYQIRVGKYLDKDRKTAVELSLDHSKYTSVRGQKARVTGIIDNKPVDQVMTLDDKTFRYDLHNGANHLMVNVVRQLPLIGDPRKGLNVSAIAKAGVGVMLPHADNTVLGNTYDPGPKSLGNALGVTRGWWQLDGWTTGAEVGLRLSPDDRFYMEVSDKIAYSKMTGVNVYQGTASQDLWMNQLSFSLGANIGGGRRRYGVMTEPQPRGPVTYGRKSGWRASIGPMRTQYFPTTIDIETSRVRGRLAITPVERTSMEYYDIFNNPQPEPWRVIDEPSNSITLTYENWEKLFAISLRERHYKMLMSDGDHTGRFTGTMDGQYMDEDIVMSERFPSYKLTQGFANFEILAEKMAILTAGRLGTLIYAPGVGVGLYTGYGDVDYIPPGQTEVAENSSKAIKIIGKSVALSNRVSYFTPRDRFSLSLIHELMAGSLKYPMLDGHARQPLNTQTLTLEAGFRILPWRNKPKIAPLTDL
jgi:hypothetical protein